MKGYKLIHLKHINVIPSFNCETTTQFSNCSKHYTNTNKMFKILLLGACIFIVSLALEADTRPKSCAVGETYKKGCNTCTCAADGKDKCSQLDCSRTGTTAKPANGVRPGDCPSLVTTPRTTNDICKNRTKKNECVKDTDCDQAKKCCIDGCGIMLCRAAIYNYGKN